MGFVTFRRTSETDLIFELDFLRHQNTFIDVVMKSTPFLVKTNCLLSENSGNPFLLKIQILIQTIQILLREKINFFHD